MFNWIYQLYHGVLCRDGCELINMNLIMPHKPWEHGHAEWSMVGVVCLCGLQSTEGNLSMCACMAMGVHMTVVTLYKCTEPRKVFLEAC